MTTAASPPRVAWASRRFGALFARWPALVRILGTFESTVLRDEIDATPLRAPVYVCGMARAGTTVLLQALARHPDFTSHRYSDYPAVFTPYWWNRLRPHVLPRDAGVHERAHGDRIAVGLESPEAFEEPLWMAFMPWLQQGERNAWLDAGYQNAAFERFHRDHLRKLLRVRGATRYVAKANTLLTRLPYLRRLYPDVRIVLPLRDPVAHVASLLRQDARFIALSREDAQIPRHLARTGHFEFGPQKRAVRGADPQQAMQIEQAWAEGNTVLGYALQWNALYGGVLARLQADPALRAACLPLDYETLCAQPQATLRRMFEHAQAWDAAAERIVADSAAQISAPDYYRTGLSDAQINLIRSLCEPVRLGWQRLRDEM